MKRLVTGKATCLCTCMAGATGSWLRFRRDRAGCGQRGRVRSQLPVPGRSRPPTGPGECEKVADARNATTANPPALRMGARAPRCRRRAAAVRLARHACATGPEVGMEVRVRPGPARICSRPVG